MKYITKLTYIIMYDIRGIYLINIQSNEIRLLRIINY